jgi:hypothetical protein
MTWMNNIPQWGVIFLLAIRSARVIYADLKDSHAREAHGVLGVMLTEAAYVGLLVGLLWWGGFWRFQ